MKCNNILIQTYPFENSLRSSHMKKTWDFLQGSIPEFKHPDEDLSENKPQAAERGPRLNRSPGPGLEDTKDLSNKREIVVCASYYPLQPQGSSRGARLMVNLHSFFRVA